MSWVRRFDRAIRAEPALWIPSAMFLAVALAIVFWSLKIGLLALVGLWVMLFVPGIQRLYMAALAGCWGLVWYETITWFSHSLAKHSNFLDRMPIYLASALCLYFFGRWMLDAFVGGVLCHEEHQRNEAGAREHQRAAAAEQPIASQHPELFDPYTVLGVSPGADKGEIKDGYRRQMALYHPDKVQHLGDDLKVTADRRTREIQRAFEILSQEPTGRI